MNNRVKITSYPIVLTDVSHNLIKSDCGAVVTFIGTVRNTSNDGRPVKFLDIQKTGDNPGEKLQKIATDVSVQWQLKPEDIIIHRRIGKLSVGDIALFVAVTAQHRQEAFAACAYIVDMIKKGEITVEKDI